MCNDNFLQNEWIIQRRNVLKRNSISYFLSVRFHYFFFRKKVVIVCCLGCFPPQERRLLLYKLFSIPTSSDVHWLSFANLSNGLNIRITFSSLYSWSVTVLIPAFVWTKIFSEVRRRFFNGAESSKSCDNESSSDWKWKSFQNSEIILLRSGVINYIGFRWTIYRRLVNACSLSFSRALAWG